MKDKLIQVLINLRMMEVRGQDNVLILAQTFVDLENIIKQMDESEKQLSEAMIDPNQHKQSEEKVDKK